jgi:hypothetical protein
MTPELAALAAEHDQAELDRQEAEAEEEAERAAAWLAAGTAAAPPWEPVEDAAALAGALAAAPRDLRVLWALAWAGHGYGWRAWRIGPAAAPDGWTLAITAPGGVTQMYTWVRRGHLMPLVAQAEIPALAATT